MHGYKIFYLLEIEICEHYLAWTKTKTMIFFLLIEINTEMNIKYK